MSLSKSWEERGCSSVGGSPGSLGESSELGVVAHTCQPCSWEMEVGGPEAQGQSALATSGFWVWSLEESKPCYGIRN